MSPCNDRSLSPEESKRVLIASLDPALDAERKEAFRKIVEKMKRTPATAIIPDRGFFDSGSGAIEGVEGLKKRVDVMERKLENLIDAISLNHVGHPPEGRSDACWSCKVVETVLGIKAAQRLMSEGNPE